MSTSEQQRSSRQRQRSSPVRATTRWYRDEDSDVARNSSNRLQRRRTSGYVSDVEQCATAVMQHGRNRKRNVDRDADSSFRRSTREGCVQHNGQLQSVVAVAKSADERRSLFTDVQEVSDVCDVTHRRRNRRRRSSTNSGNRDRRRRRGVSSSTSDDNRSDVHRHHIRLRNFDGSGLFEQPME